LNPRLELDDVDRPFRCSFHSGPWHSREQSQRAI
jgi:hypothetical protein